MHKETVYLFKGINGLHANLNGNFFFNGAPIAKIYNNGSLAVRVGKTKYGIKKLRTLAYKSTIPVNDLPF